MTELESRCRAVLAHLADAGGAVPAAEVLPDLTPDQRAPVVRVLSDAGLARYEGGARRRWVLTRVGWGAMRGRR